MYLISSSTGMRHKVDADMPGSDTALRMLKRQQPLVTLCGRSMTPVNFYDPGDTSTHPRYRYAGCFGSHEPGADEPAGYEHHAATAEADVTGHDPEAAMTQVTYTAGEIIEYTSFDPSGFTAGQVVRYAPAGEQTRLCPNCGELAMPGPGSEGSLRTCPRCLASVRFPALDPLVYIRTRNGGKPFPVRESQIRQHETGHSTS